MSFDGRESIADGTFRFTYDTNNLFVSTSNPVKLSLITISLYSNTRINVSKQPLRTTEKINTLIITIHKITFVII